MLKSKIAIICAIASLIPNLLPAASLRDMQDDKRVLANPDKGWYHHYYDNSLEKYLSSDESIAAIPNMHHLFLRFAWCFLEPEEGKFNWALIDDIVDKWYPRGVKVSLSITCNETGETYATPKWVFDAGAKANISKSKWGKEIVEPQLDDPVFMQKLENLHRAIAERYDGKPFIVDMTLASIGNWGEGHYSSTSRTIVPLETIKKHIDLYKKYYKKSRLTIGDDWLGNNLKGDELLAARGYVKSNKIGYRDDSILVQWHYFAPVHNGKDSLLRPEFFEDIYDCAPATLEFAHYSHQKKVGSWKGKNGCEEGAEAMKRVAKKSHCTYMGYHGDAAEYLRDNPDFLNEMANRIGYWYFINSADFNPQTGERALEWENRGAAHAFNRYSLFVKIKNLKDSVELIFPISSADNRKFEPDLPIVQTYAIPVSNLAKGDYEISVLLKKTSPQNEARAIELGLKKELRDSDGFYRILNIKI